MGHRSHATPQDHDITAGIARGAALFRQGAVGRHHRLQLLIRRQGGGQGDQAAGLVGADGTVNELPA